MDGFSTNLNTAIAGSLAAQRVAAEPIRKAKLARSASAEPVDEPEADHADGPLAAADEIDRVPEKLPEHAPPPLADEADNEPPHIDIQA